MSPVELIHYTNSHKKISGPLLMPQSYKETPVNYWQILAGHGIDAAGIFMLASSISATFQFSFKSLMISSTLSEAFDLIPFAEMTLITIPFILLNYYFFSFFFNHGQSWGMNTLKSRIEMNQLSFKMSLVWAVFSTLVIMSAGAMLPLGYKWLVTRGWGKFKTHDHLYQNMMLEKTFSPVNVLEIADSHSPGIQELDTSYKQAA